MENIKSLKKNNNFAIPALQSPTGLVFSDKEKADVLAKSMKKIHKQTANMSNADIINQVENTLQNFFRSKITVPDEQLTSPTEIKKCY